MAHYARKDSDLQATEKILRKIMSTGRDTGRFSDKAGRSSFPMRSSPHRKSHPPSRKSEVGGKSTPGATLLQMNLNTADPNEAMLKRTHDGVNRDSSPACTVHTGQSYASKKRAVANGSTPTKSPGLLSRGDKHLTGVLVEKKILDLDSQDRWNTSYQALRLEKEWIELHDRRSMKRNSEILRHRVDKMYMMSGSGIKLKAKYEISENELQQLKDLSEARRVLREKSQKTHPIPKAPKVSLDHGYFKNSKDKDGQQEIRIQGEGQGSVGTPQRGESVADNVRNPHTAEWASEADAHQHPTPQSEKSEDGKPGGTFLTEGNHGNTSEINGNHGDTVEAEGNHGDAGETEGNHGDAADTEGNHGNTSEINGNHGDTVEAEGNLGDAETEGNHGDAADTEGINGDNANSERESNHDETGNTDESQNNTIAGVKTETQEVDQSEAQSGQEVADQEEAGGQSGDRQAVDDGDDGVVEGEAGRCG
ncbi:anti-sigma-I factor RsgI-like isoform X3 [Haliotis rufescens]|uniref:anti-sigma-I factor RsgI-like isoform X3 n=1 Tax=Haliotis rufescens TaxID=6454 RepID=UPI00201ECF67|nr:anti-sigma-I factor RsgI-like isoform X3 [Haliotis rufescens]